MSTKPSTGRFSVFKQVCDLIPPHLTASLAAKHGIIARKISPWSHLVALLYGQFTHAFGLNDICDGLKYHARLLLGIRGATAPSRNGLSHANRNRSSEFMKELFWNVLESLSKSSVFKNGRLVGKLPRRFKADIAVVDSSTIELVANCMDWAKHRAQKAAAKLHLRMGLRDLMPQAVTIDTAKHNDNYHARSVCHSLKAGSIVIFDKAYVDYLHLFELTQRTVNWVSRAKDNMKVVVVKRLLKKPNGKILRDDVVRLVGPLSKKRYPATFRRVIALVMVDGTEREMTFITNNMVWAPSSVADLYQSRWSIEAFFKQLKQILHLRNFLGHNRNAIELQIWTALLLYVLLRYLQVVQDWPHSFTRLFTLLRGSLWSCFELSSFIGSCGIASPPKQLDFEQLLLFC